MGDFILIWGNKMGAGKLRSSNTMGNLVTNVKQRYVAIYYHFRESLLKCLGLVRSVRSLCGRKWVISGVNMGFSKHRRLRTAMPFFAAEQLINMAGN